MSLINLKSYKIALAGNPNTGKSTVFNGLTGLKQHTGNWPGKTVAKAEGMYSFNNTSYRLIDLPGTYSLLSNSPEEEIARNYILFSKPDAIVVVVDATSLERNLNLVLQILEISNKVVICLNLMDEAKRKGIQIDSKELSRQLGVPVVETIASRKAGFNSLVKEIEKVAAKALEESSTIEFSGELEKAVLKLVSMLKKEYPDIPNKQWIALRLLEGDKRIEEAVIKGFKNV